MCTPVDSECTLATVSFSEQVVLAWKDACNKAKGSCLRRRRGGGRLLSRAVMVFDALLRVLRTLIVVFLRIYHMYRKKANEHRPVRYYNIPLSPVTEKRLLSLRRKVMVLDLDETLIHSHHDGNYTPSATSSRPDFVVRVSIEGHPVRFFVYKRPHVDFFLSMVCQWYELVVFTASMQKYGMEVANHLDDNRGILTTRYFRQNCTVDVHGYTKDLTMVHEDLSSIFILDNSPSAYRGNRANAIPIKSWFSDPSDEALLDLLPFLDALRFTHDVRTVLSRNLQQHTAW